MVWISYSNGGVRASRGCPRSRPARRPPGQRCSGCATRPARARRRSPAGGRHPRTAASRVPRSAASRLRSEPYETFTATPRSASVLASARRRYSGSNGPSSAAQSPDRGDQSGRGRMCSFDTGQPEPGGHLGQAGHPVRRRPPAMSAAACRPQDPLDEPVAIARQYLAAAGVGGHRHLAGGPVRRWHRAAHPVDRRPAHAVGGRRWPCPPAGR